MSLLAAFVSVSSLTVVALSILIYQRPYLLLKVPKIGFYLFATIGGGEIPPPMDLKIFNRSEEWLRPNDVIVSVPAKSGTHWTMYTLNMIRAKGNPAPFEDIYTETPWPEFMYYPGQPMEERIEYLKNLSRRFPFAIYKSHFAPPSFPVRDDVKYVVMVRNTCDAVASLRHFYQSFTKEFARMWGGFPPNAGMQTSLSEWEQFVIEDAGNGEPFVATLMQPLIGWWPYRRNKNVLIMHYSDRVRDDEKQIRRLSAFLGVELTPQQVKDIAFKVSFKEMKARAESTVEFRHLYDEFKRRGKVPNDLFVLDLTLDSPMMASGPARVGETENSARIKKKVKSMLLERFGAKLTHWVENGGDLPIDEELPTAARA